jgi:C-terminal domain on Strawberry notch homologue
MQCFGRTHRSDQAVPPEYVLLSTELGGEKRFSSTIARRLASLGALTKGDRSAADNADWARYNFETQEGKAALGLLYKRILEGETVRGLKDPRQTLRDIGLLIIQDGVERIRKEDEHNVPRFLNRILALEVDEQNALFDYFADLFDQTVRYAKASGTFDEGVTDIKALAIRIAKPPAVVHRDRVTGAETVLYTLEVDQPSDKVSFERADRLRISERGAFFRHKQRGDFVLALPSGRHTDPDDGKTFLTYSIWKPGGARTAYLREQELNAKYRVVTSDQVRHWWERQHERVPEIETREVRIIGGAIIPLWQKLKTKDDARLKVVRVSTAEGQRIVGVEIPRSHVGRVLCALGLTGPSREPGQMFHDILDGAECFNLTAGLKLKRSTLQREPVIELESHDSDRFEELRKLGFINEQIRYKQHFFVPADEEKGIPILAELLGRYPLAPEDEPENVQQEVLAVEVPATEAAVIDLASWALPPTTSTPPFVITPSEPPPTLGSQAGPSWLTLTEQKSYIPSPRRHRLPSPVDAQQTLFAFED